MILTSNTVGKAHLLLPRTHPAQVACGRSFRVGRLVCEPRILRVHQRPTGRREIVLSAKVRLLAGCMTLSHKLNSVCNRLVTKIRLRTRAPMLLRVALLSRRARTSAVRPHLAILACCLTTSNGVAVWSCKCYLSQLRQRDRVRASFRLAELAEQGVDDPSQPQAPEDSMLIPSVLRLSAAADSGDGALTVLSGRAKLLGRPMVCILLPSARSGVD